MIRVIRVFLLFIVIFFTAFFLSGCWNYREIDKISIVGGLAIDRSEDNKYLITVEVIDIKGGQEAKIMPKTITMTGNTLFDAIRNTISLSGKKLYWSHTKVLILSQFITKDDMVKILDWFNRDAEARADINILVSKEKTAKEILESKAIMNEVVSYGLDDMLSSESNLSKAPKIAINDFIIDIAGKGIEPIAPAIGLAKADNKVAPQIMGSVFFAKDKKSNFINGEETRDLLFVRDMIKGGVLVQEEKSKEESTKITLEIFKSKTNLKPVIKDDNVEMQINIETTVAIDEIMGIENYTDEEGRMKLIKDAEQNMNKKIKLFIQKVQSEYGNDVLGFGAKIREGIPKEWKKLEPEWKEKFKTLKVTVNTKFHIKNSGKLYKTLPVGD